jgi:DNA mismatch endonuclease (patch repair protein)
MVDRLMDVFTKKKRSWVMSRIRGTDTGVEVALRGRLHRLGYRFRKHVRDLPGTPDLVFVAKRIAVFIDGDFWHGWRFPRWVSKLQPRWSDKIATNRARDRSNHRKLRARGWTVIRVWEHEIERDLDACVSKVEGKLASSRTSLLGR